MKWASLYESLNFQKTVNYSRWQPENKLPEQMENKKILELMEKLGHEIQFMKEKRHATRFKRFISEMGGIVALVATLAVGIAFIARLDNRMINVDNDIKSLATKIDKVDSALIRDTRVTRYLLFKDSTLLNLLPPDLRNGW